MPGAQVTAAGHGIQAIDVEYIRPLQDSSHLVIEDGRIKGVVTKRGTIEADITVARLAEDRFLLITGTAFGLHDSQWIKQHLQIKSFFGTSENAVKTQIWIAVSVYVLVAIIKKRLKLEMSLNTILQILSITFLPTTVWGRI